MFPCPSLHIVTVGDPILRQEARYVSPEEIRSPEMQSLIEEMHLFLNGKGVGLAAPQIGHSIQVIMVEDTAELAQRWLTPQQILERERFPISWQVFFNPKLHRVESSGERIFFEGCLSVPSMVALVPRAHTVRLEALDGHGDPVRLEAKGWFARILQHETDHLHGILFLDRMLPKTLMTQEHYEQTWRTRPVSEVLEAFGCASSS